MLLANFDRKEHLQHRAVSLRQHGFLVYYALEVCPLNKSDIKALDYVLFSSFCKIFRTKSKDVVDD